MLIAEKTGKLSLPPNPGRSLKSPAYRYEQQNGLLGVCLASSYSSDSAIYLTYSKPGQISGISSLALARAPLKIGISNASDEMKIGLEDPRMWQPYGAESTIAGHHQKRLTKLRIADQASSSKAHAENNPFTTRKSAPTTITITMSCTAFIR